MSRAWSFLFALMAMLVVVSRAEDAEGEEEDGAHSEQEGMREMMQEMDTDKDGSLTLAEILASMESENTEGESEDQEEKKKLVEQIKTKFAAADANSDGLMPLEEWTAFVKAFETEDEM
eukprot:TRINITY_DN1307_c0_g1_i3.p2 TRINITY_DN1307_c0_g1~~TRINITY_DN1307_c0_g1_i3.p2  ORF type:complete len:137 (+),score=45.71 TRINITY_DN1307_c0_g1_i3:55-411(+)